ncbi:isochorismatase family protein [Novipirellula sp. SH528]|uniref:isochorismatase family protein n=1 Tax=Novipirellula sp. SH528 TaxID=3454466 RepID=UPI003FA0C60D
MLHRRVVLRQFLTVVSAIAMTACFTATAAAETLTLHPRSQVSDGGGGQPRYLTTTETQSWKAEETAIIVCDMWDQHWCDGATKRVAEMALHMNTVISQARNKGVLIIHCPSSVVDYYKDTPMRKLAQQAPSVETALPLKRWAYLDPSREPPLPIDDSDGGCDCDPACKTRQAWSRQIDTIEIRPGDAITDNAEAFYLMKQRGIRNVIVMGVHMNMCVLGRPFSIRQLVYQGQNVVLMRDLSDTMYNHRQSPYVDHFDGNRLVTMHIERYWCPTITSTDITGKPAFQFAADK